MIITLTNPTVSASIDSMGAQLISLKDHSGLEYIWQRDSKFWGKASPLLFPAIGNSRNGKTLFEGAVYELPKHGFCQGTDFQVRNQTETSVTFWTCDNEHTKTMYPYRFQLALTYRLTEDGIHMDYLVTNLDDRTICYCLGAHPGFNCPLFAGERFEDYQLELEKKETLSAMVYDLENLQFDASRLVPILQDNHVIPLDYRLFEQDALFFDKLASRKVSIVHPVTRKGVEVDFQDFDSVAFWTPVPKNPPFLCVEPWNGSAIRSDEDDDFLHKHGVQTLEQGDAKSYHLGIRIL